jgi:hypothetical protein
VHDVLLLAADAQPFAERLVLAAVPPILGGLIIGGALQWVASRVQTRREEHNLRHELVKDMTQFANALYMATQLYWRVNTGRDPRREDELREVRRQLDEQYLASRTAGLVLETRLAAHFTADEVRQRWHRTMDFLTVRYFQVLYPDTGADRAKRLARLYANNAKPSCTNVSAAELNDAQVVLTGYRRALDEATILALTAKLRTPDDLMTAYDHSAETAQRRAAEHPSGDVPAAP